MLGAVNPYTPTIIYHSSVKLHKTRGRGRTGTVKADRVSRASNVASA